MKSPITWLPTMMLFGFLAAGAAHDPTPSAPKTASARTQEIRELRHELQDICNRLDRLDVETHHVVPRGGLR